MAHFDRRRLRLARESRGLTQSELATRAAITAAAVSQFENGTSRPSSETLGFIASALDFPSTFLVGAPGATVGEGLGAYFRSLRSTTASARRRARAQVQLLAYLTRVLDHRVRLPTASVPRHELTLQAEDPEVEGVADATRKAWRLPPGPIEHVVRTLERHGVIVARFPVESQTVDAFSVPFPDRPIIVLGADKGDRARSRFDAAHELAHFVIHGQAAFGTKRLETQAQVFAAAFLMPATQIRRELPTWPDWEELFALKRKWGVSVAALLRRCRDLHVMSEHTYVQAMKAMSARGWRRAEPGYLGAPETPTLLGLAVQALENRGIGVKELAAEAHLPVRDVERFIGAASDTRIELNI